LVHFLFQTGFLLKKLKRDKLLTYIRHGLSRTFLSNDRGRNLLPDEMLITAYCLFMAVTEDMEDIWGITAFERRWLLVSLKNS